jgi:hypothetical protein
VVLRPRRQQSGQRSLARRGIRDLRAARRGRPGGERRERRFAGAAQRGRPTDVVLDEVRPTEQRLRRGGVSRRRSRATGGPRACRCRGLRCGVDRLPARPCPPDRGPRRRRGGPRGATRRRAGASPGGRAGRRGRHRRGQRASDRVAEHRGATRTRAPQHDAHDRPVDPAATLRTVDRPGGLADRREVVAGTRPETSTWRSAVSSCQ